MGAKFLSSLRFLALICSGEAQRSVNQFCSVFRVGKVVAMRSDFKLVLKSQRTGWPPSSTRTFSGFKSKC